jgi:hypothetical protein
MPRDFGATAPCLGRQNNAWTDFNVIWVLLAHTSSVDESPVQDTRIRIRLVKGSGAATDDQVG